MKTSTFFRVFIISIILMINYNAFSQKHPPRKAPNNKHKAKHIVPLPHQRYKNMPRLGVVIAPPSTAIVIKHKGIAFRFNNGIWYKPKGPDFIIVRPPVGVRIKTLPLKHRKVVIHNVTYYYYYGVYYKKIENSNEYEVVEQPIGAIIDALPEGYETKTIDGTEYYILDDVYYKAVECEEGTCYQSVEVK